MPTVARNTAPPVRADARPAEGRDTGLHARDLLLLLPPIVLLFVHLGRDQAWGSESRWLSIATSMRGSGDWFAPLLNGELYWDKPLYSYWAILVAAWPFGQVNELVARLPSALGSALTVLLTSWLGARLLERKIGVLAGWLLATSFSYFVWARTASADALNLTCILAAVVAYAEHRLHPRPWLVYTYFAILGVGAHVKGLPAVLVPCAIVGVDIIASRELSALRRPATLAGGALVFLALFLAPFFASRLLEGNWDLLRLMWRENIVRAVDPFDHDDASWFYYFYVFPTLFLPWSLWLPGALPWAVRAWRRSAGLRFTLVGLLTVFVLFTASRSRRSYYILPILPFAAILVAAFLRQAELVLVEAAGGGSLGGVNGAEAEAAAAALPTSPSQRVGRGRLWSVLLRGPRAILLVALSVGSVYLLLGRLLPGKAGEVVMLLPLSVALGVACGLWVGLYLASVRRQGAAGRPLAFATLGLLLSAYQVFGVEALRAGSLTEREFVSEVAGILGGAGRRVVVFGSPGGRLWYYLSTHPELEVVERRDTKKSPLEPGEQGYVLTDRDELPRLEAIPGVDAQVLATARTASFGSLKMPRETYYLLSVEMGR